MTLRLNKVIAINKTVTLAGAPHRQIPAIRIIFSEEWGNMIQDTSKEAYKDIKESGVSDSQVNLYLHHLSTLHDATDKEMGKFIKDSLGNGIPPSQVSARRNDVLRNRPHTIEMAAKRKCRISGKTAQAWRVKKVDQHQSSLERFFS